jgi:single-strand DNA-binding protein
MTDTIALTGLVATTPKHLVTGDGLSITNFRLASQQRKFDRSENKWVDGETNWYTVTSFRQLANNVVSSVQKGQRVVVVGRLRLREWSTDDKKGTSVEVDAEAVGHDLTWGTAQFTRSAAAAVAEAEAPAESEVPAASEPQAQQAEGDGDDVETTREREAVAVRTPF